MSDVKNRQPNYDVISVISEFICTTSLLYLAGNMTVWLKVTLWIPARVWAFCTGLYHF